jgi:hypothetical protein
MSELLLLTLLCISSIPTALSRQKYWKKTTPTLLSNGIQMMELKQFSMFITATCKFAAAGNANDILESTAIYLALTTIENTGFFTNACSNWCKHSAADQTLTNFQADFTHMWKGHDHYISAKAAGYQALLMTHLENKENQSPNVSPSKTKPDAIMH